MHYWFQRRCHNWTPVNLRVLFFVQLRHHNSVGRLKGNELVPTWRGTVKTLQLPYMLSPRIIYKPRGVWDAPLSSENTLSWLCSRITFMVWSNPFKLPWKNVHVKSVSKLRETNTFKGNCSALTTMLRPSLVMMLTVSEVQQNRLSN